MNVYDSERMYELMKPHGYRISENYEDSDLIIKVCFEDIILSHEKLYISLYNTSSLIALQSNNLTKRCIPILECKFIL